MYNNILNLCLNILPTQSLQEVENASTWNRNDSQPFFNHNVTTTASYRAGKQNASSEQTDVEARANGRVGTTWNSNWGKFCANGVALTACLGQFHTKAIEWEAENIQVILELPQSRIVRTTTMNPYNELYKQFSENLATETKICATFSNDLSQMCDDDASIAFKVRPDANKTKTVSV